MDLRHAVTRPAVRRASYDPLGLAVYRVAGQSVTVTSDTEVPTAGVMLADWYADRVRIDLVDMYSSTGTTFTWRILSGDQCEADGFAEQTKGSVVIPANQSVSRTCCIVSGWLFDFVAIVGRVTPGSELRFTVRWTLDRAGAGLYAALGEGMVP